MRALKSWTGLLPVFITGFILISGAVSLVALADYVGWYGSLLCEDKLNYGCVTVGTKVVEREISTASGTRTVGSFADADWKDMWPDRRQREIIMKVNRMNVSLKSGMKIAVPRNISKKRLMDFSPFPKRGKSEGEPYVVFDPRLLAFAAYDDYGRLVRWGPAVGGRAGRPTPIGRFRIRSKGDESCRSRKYPVGCEGRACSPMPYCMEFINGAALHAGDLPGRHESHGCVRLFHDDAEWLNTKFADLGTLVIVKPYY